MVNKADIFEPALEKESMERTRKEFNLLFDLCPKDKTIFKEEYISELMQGLIDFHIHAGPESGSNRVYDDDQIALDACKAGLKAIVLKSHSIPSVARASLVKKITDKWAQENGKKPLDVFGGVVLNYPAGGLNPAAVKVCIDLGGKFVWTPSVHSSHHFKMLGKSGGIDVLDENGKVVPELLNIFEIIRDNNLILGLSHHTVYERFVMIETAVKMGLKKIVVNHPLGAINNALPEQIAQMAEMGAHIGVTFATSVANLYTPGNMEGTMKVLKLVGFDKVVGGSEMSQLGTPPPVVGMECFLRTLLAFGVSADNIKKMFDTTPSKLLYE